MCFLRNRATVASLHETKLMSWEILAPTVSLITAPVVSTKPEQADLGAADVIKSYEELRTEMHRPDVEQKKKKKRKKEKEEKKKPFLGQSFRRLPIWLLPRPKGFFF